MVVVFIASSSLSRTLFCSHGIPPTAAGLPKWPEHPAPVLPIVLQVEIRAKDEGERIGVETPEPYSSS
jgi:hypothetical protein